MSFLKKIRLMLVESHEMVAFSLSLVFNEVEDFELIGRARDGEEAMQMIAQLQPDVVLVDLTMFRQHGFHIIPQIRENFPRVGVVVLSSSLLKSDLEGAISAGAHAFLVADSSVEYIVDTIRTVVRQHNN